MTLACHKEAATNCRLLFRLPGMAGRQADSGCSLESPLQHCNVVNKQKSMLTTPCNNYNKSNCNNNEINKLQLLGRATSQPVRQSTNQGIQSAAPGTPDGHTDRHTALVRLSALQEGGVGGAEGRGIHCSWRRRPIDSTRRIIRGPPCNGHQLNCVGWQQQQQQQLQLPRQPKGSCSRGQYSASCSFNCNSNSNCSSNCSSSFNSGWVTCPAMAMNCSKWRCLTGQEVRAAWSNCHFCRELE